jgi:hypothetical protein
MIYAPKIYFMDMDIDTGKKRQFPALVITTVLFLLCIFQGQFWAAKFFPNLSGLIQIKPSLIFVEIPVQLPFSIDLILVSCLFFLIYPFVVLLYPSRPGIPSWQQAILRVRNVFVGLFALLFCMLAGAWIYYLVQDKLSLPVRNGIDSMGINADIHLAYRGYENIHLRGSLVIFLCFVIGLIICIRKIRKEPGGQAGRLTREQRMTPYERMIEEKRMMRKTGINKQEPQTAKSWQPVYPDVVKRQSNWNAQPRVCDNQPVFTFTPVAVRYMPM